MKVESLCQPIYQYVCIVQIRLKYFKNDALNVYNIAEKKWWNRELNGSRRRRNEQKLTTKAMQAGLGEQSQNCMENHV